jgi:hypothetical protein
MYLSQPHAFNRAVCFKKILDKSDRTRAVSADLRTGYPLDASLTRHSSVYSVDLRQLYLFHDVYMKFYCKEIKIYLEEMRVKSIFPFLRYTNVLSQARRISIRRAID